MNTPYDEREVLALLQDEKTQRRGFEMIVAQYSEQGLQQNPVQPGRPYQSFILFFLGNCSSYLD